METEDAIAWANRHLTEFGPTPIGPAEPVRTMPWSMVARIPTVGGHVYIKQMGYPFDREQALLNRLSGWDRDSNWPLPKILAANQELSCFLMEDAGTPLRDCLKENYQTDIVLNLMSIYTSIQKACAPKIEELLVLGLPDWRLENWQQLYDELIEHLASQAIAADCLQALKDRRSMVSDLCASLNQYPVPATLEHTDFNDSNVLIKDGSITLNDWGDATISHPFFSLASWLGSACRTHSLMKGGERYTAIRDSYLQGWASYDTFENLLQAFAITAKLNSLRFALSFSRVSQCEGFESYAEYKPHITQSVNEFINDNP